ncbi:MAG: hypothetical protein K0R44_103 [Thermomicrobiales bacterium]|nr:hypothetical protein [Thermomicrobiales bacterium]
MAIPVVVLGAIATRYIWEAASRANRSQEPDTRRGERHNLRRCCTQSHRIAVDRERCVATHVLAQHREGILPLLEDPEQALQALTCARALGRAQHGVRRELVLVEDHHVARGAHPHVEVQVDQTDPALRDYCRLGDVAVPAFAPAVGAGDLLHIEPAIGVVVLREAGDRLEADAAEVSCWQRSGGGQHHSIGSLFNEFGWVAQPHPVPRVQFDDGHRQSRSQRQITLWQHPILQPTEYLVPEPGLGS